MTLSRRSMMTHSIAVLGAAALTDDLSGAELPKRKFTMDLRGGSVGIRADQREQIRLASKYGFESVNVDAGFLAKLSDSERDELESQMKEKKLVWGAAGLPVNVNGDEASFRNGAQNLAKLAQAMQQAGVTRVNTWIPPSHATLTYVQNFRQMARRFRECATILKDHGQRLGLEYIGPKTLWASKLHPFIHTMAEAKDFIAEIGTGNVGFVLDSWHWYTAHESAEDLATLTNDDIVACDLNDAPTGRAIDEQLDSQRELPMATGVIDLRAFLTELVKIGYDGPIRAEPFNKELDQLDNEEAAEATAKAMKKAFAMVE